MRIDPPILTGSALTDCFLQECQRKIRDLAVVVFLHLLENIEYIYFFGGEEEENFFHYGYWALFFCMRQA